MKLPFLPRFFSPKTLSQYPPALLGGLLLCVFPTAAQGQSVTFAGTPTILPTSGLYDPFGIAADSAGDVLSPTFTTGAWWNCRGRRRAMDLLRPCRPTACTAPGELPWTALAMCSSPTLAIIVL